MTLKIWNFTKFWLIQWGHRRTHCPWKSPAKDKNLGKMTLTKSSKSNTASPPMPIVNPPPPVFELATCKSSHNFKSVLCKIKKSIKAVQHAKYKWKCTNLHLHKSTEQSSGQIQCNAAQNGNSVKCWESAGGPHCSVKHDAENWLNVEEMWRWSA